MALKNVGILLHHCMVV